MRHEEAIRRLPDLLGLHTTGAWEAELREHLAGCAACHDMLASLQTTDRALADLQRERPGADLTRRVLAIPQTETSHVRSMRHRLRGPWGFAAGAALAVVAVVLTMTFAFDGRTHDRGFLVARSVTFDGERGVSARLELARPEGANQPVRLAAEGISPTGAPYYTLWLTDGRRRVSAGTFRPDADGDCAVIGVVPRDVAWSQVVITRGDTVPDAGNAVAAGAF